MDLRGQETTVWGAEYTGTVWYVSVYAISSASFLVKVGGGTSAEPEKPVEPEKPAESEQPTVYPSNQTMTIDGKKVEFQMYSIKDENGRDTNYIKIRDLALALKGTAAQFDIGKVDGTITFTKGGDYKPDGSENKTPYSGQQPCTAGVWTVSVDGTAVEIETFQITYNGGGYTCFQVKDIAQKLNFNAAWRGGIVIETDKPYTGK